MEDKSTDKQLNNTRETNPNSLANLKKAKPWKSGQSGNPVGRPKDKKYISEALKDLLASNPDLLLDIVNAIIKEASKGNVQAFKELTDRSEGKVADKIEGTDIPVTIILKRAEDRDA